MGAQFFLKILRQKVAIVVDAPNGEKFVGHSIPLLLIGSPIDFGGGHKEQARAVLHLVFICELYENRCVLSSHTFALRRQLRSANNGGIHELVPREQWRIRARSSCQGSNRRYGTATNSEPLLLVWSCGNQIRYNCCDRDGRSTQIRKRLAFSCCGFRLTFVRGKFESPQCQDSRIRVVPEVLCARTIAGPHACV